MVVPQLPALKCFSIVDFLTIYVIYLLSNSKNNFLIKVFGFRTFFEFLTPKDDLNKYPDSNKRDWRKQVPSSSLNKLEDLQSSNEEHQIFCLWLQRISMQALSLLNDRDA